MLFPLGFLYARVFFSFHAQVFFLFVLSESEITENAQVRTRTRDLSKTMINVKELDHSATW